MIVSNEDGQTFGVYCGDKTGKKVLVTGDLVVMKFHSDRFVPRKGFHMVLTAVSLGRLLPFTLKEKYHAETFNDNNISSHLAGSHAQ